MLSHDDYVSLVAEGRYDELPDPVVPLHAPFENEAGSIQNIFLGSLGAQATSAAVIRSRAGSLRANHWHRTDWHFSYILTGSVVYFWRPVIVEPSIHARQRPSVDRYPTGTLFFTPPGLVHAMYFPKDTIFLTLARNLRDHEHHEEDVVRERLVEVVSNPGDADASIFLYPGT